MAGDYWPQNQFPGYHYRWPECGSATVSSPRYCVLCEQVHDYLGYCRGRELRGMAQAATGRVMPFSVAMQRIRAKKRKDGAP